VENSSFGRLIGVLVAPAKTFRSIAARPTWLVAFLVVMWTPLIPGLMAAKKMDWEGIIKGQLERMDVQIPQEQVEQRVEMMEKIGPYLTFVSPFFIAAFLLVSALVFWGAFTLAGGEVGFVRSLAVMSHGMMTLVVSSLLSIPIVLGLDKIGAEVAAQGGALKSNLAAFAPEDTGPVLINFLSHIDAFSIWSLVLLTLGYAYAAKVKKSTSATIVVAGWLLYVGISVGFAALGVMMGGKR
jgi:hypothetical protein